MQLAACGYPACQSTTWEGLQPLARERAELAALETTIKLYTVFIFL
jgi:hypothetical protein